MLPGAALGSLAARFCWQSTTSGSGRYPSAFRGPLLMVSGAALGSLAARFCWQGQHFRLSSAFRAHPLLMLPGAALGSLAAGGSTSGFPRARFGAPPVDAARRRSWEPRGSFLLAGAALQALDEPRSSFLLAGQHFRLWTVPERVSAGPRRSTWEPRGSFLCWQGQHFRLSNVPERVSGPPALMLPGAALGSLAARFCWQGQHFTLDGTRARFGALLLMLPGAALGLVSAGRGSTSGSGRCPSAFRGPPLIDRLTH